MADKSFIQMKLDKDNALNELKQVVPGLRALQYYHNNPDSSFANTLDLLAEDIVPFYAAHKYGAEPEDYVKEAFLVGMTPGKVKAVKNYIKNHPNAKFENVSNELYDIGTPDSPRGEPRVNKPGYVGNFFEEEMNRVTHGEPNFRYNSVNDLLTDINESSKFPIKEDISAWGLDINDPTKIKQSTRLSKHKELYDKLDELEYLREIRESVQTQKNLNAYNNMNTTYGTVKPSNVDNILAQIDKDIKSITNDINLYNSNIDFQQEPYPYIDANKSYNENINEFMKEQTKNLKYPYLPQDY